MDALEQEGLHLDDSPAELESPMSELGAEHDKHDKCETMFRFRCGFHSGKMEGVRIKGLYTCGRDQFSEPDTAFVINSSSGMRITQLEDFRVKVLRGTDPKTTCPTFLRYVMFMGWKWLGLAAELNFGTTRGTPPLARLRLGLSAPVGSACLWNSIASVERCWVPGASDHDRGGVR